ncbi:MAG: hypothetical protein VXZ35_13535 [Pseudomonadota bacterium]|nr:hypothetical protein [Pseudomonadota bacterium]
MPDKFYYSAPEGNAPQVIRGKLSELTNLAYSVRDGKNVSQELYSFLCQLKALDHYVEAGDDFIARLENDLYNACDYWEDIYRYDDCWPIIREIWESS